ncbi:MAG TPA: alpha/beta hydrolase family protein [Armatimonadota bacterium]|jgi:S-formylglutathione hydrolase FrmB
MSFGTLTFRSSTIGRSKSLNFILPDPGAGRGPYPVFYLLHGYSDDHTGWLMNTRLVEYVAGLPLVVIMPDCEHSFYCDEVHGKPFERYLMEEIRGLVEANFNVRRTGKARCVGGLSMGGGGAMKLGLKYPELFTSVGAHSGGMDFGRYRPDRMGMLAESKRILGSTAKNNPQRQANDPFALAEALTPGKHPALYFDCGTEDFLLPGNRDLHAHLEQLGLPHVYQEFPGVHCWQYWDEHIQDSLAFHCRALGIKKG